MGVRAVVFDIGGVLEYTPKLGVYERWCGRLGSSRWLCGIGRFGVRFGQLLRADWSTTQQQDGDVAWHRASKVVGESGGKLSLGRNGKQCKMGWQLLLTRLSLGGILSHLLANCATFWRAKTS